MFYADSDGDGFGNPELLLKVANYLVAMSITEVIAMMLSKISRSRRDLRSTR